jgi:acetolactate synthase-1/2/3 large subunit
MLARRRSRFAIRLPWRLLPVYDELYKFKDQLHHVLVRHEQGATMLLKVMRATGK